MTTISREAFGTFLVFRREGAALPPSEGGEAMKFCKRYEEYMRGREKELPAVGLKKLKKILKRCRREFHSRRDGGGGKCPDNCAGMASELIRSYLFLDEILASFGENESYFFNIVDIRFFGPFACVHV